MAAHGAKGEPRGGDKAHGRLRPPGQHRGPSSTKIDKTYAQEDRRSACDPSRSVDLVALMVLDLLPASGVEYKTCLGHLSNFGTLDDPRIYIRLKITLTDSLIPHFELGS